MRESLDRLAAEQGAQLEQAEAGLAHVRRDLNETETRLGKTDEALEAERQAFDRLGGEIGALRRQVDELDLDGSRQRVQQSEAALRELPELQRQIAPEDRVLAQTQLDAAERERERAHDEARKAEGALETIGGQVIREQQETAKEALRLAEQSEGEVEVEFAAWQLLVEKLREAENTEGQHLGQALSQPITERFTELTAARYGKLEVSPDLKADGLRVAGVIRDVGKLSVGTQEQLATLLRLTVAEHLGCALLLDDHLTQTDPKRTEWFRALLRAHASKAQVIVLTCRPMDYLRPEELAAGDAVRAGGLLRGVDLGRLISRAGAAPYGA